MLYQSVYYDVIRSRRPRDAVMTVTEMKAALREIYKPFLTAELMAEICRLTKIEDVDRNLDGNRLPNIDGSRKRWDDDDDGDGDGDGDGDDDQGPRK